ncbi:hypothetical protein [Streptomyces sp. SAJ15]|uniref:hypothetical protein n=1 Tax=Streptomyces sp. SAJ15 TaxID=2011095 RepID=UPI0011867077|nr:hypothetical protein [Streptomyces sp. SAJ15]
MGESAPKGKVDAPSDSLQEFKKKVDKLLLDLGESDANHTRIGEQKVAATAYGSLPQSPTLATAYSTMHLKLQQLSKMLGEQLEAMGIAVGLADGDYQATDQKHAQRLQQIQASSKAYYEAWEKQNGKKDAPESGKGKAGGDEDLGKKGA